MLSRSSNMREHREFGTRFAPLRRSWNGVGDTLCAMPMRQVILVAICAAAVSAILVYARVGTSRVPPPTLFFAGLPVSGSLADAKRAGFDDCFATDAVHLRCRRHAVSIGKMGPYEAAVDLDGGKGEGGFDQLVIWHDRDNYAVFRIADALERAGWSYCYTGDGRWADQAIYTRNGAPVRVSLDMSFFSKRRLRLLPAASRREDRCTPA